MAAEPWQTAEVPGPLKAFITPKPQVIVAMVKKAKRPILIVGHKVAEIDLGDGLLIDYVIRLAKASHIPVVATAHTIAEFLKRGFKPAGFMPLMDIVNRLGDPGWEGLDGSRPYDLALFIGLPYYMEWLVLSGLKHFSSIRTISLERHYQPNASWSFPNISIEKWRKHLEDMINIWEGE